MVDRGSHWARHMSNPAAPGPPLAPPPPVIDAYRSVLAGRDERVLLLGVTRELAGLGQSLRAFDHNAGVVDSVWPGDTATQRADVGDWTALPSLLGADRFSAAIGDGSLNSGPYAAIDVVLAAVAAVLAPHGVIAVRAFVRPDDAGTLDDIRRTAMSGPGWGFDAFKWRFTMAMTAERGDPDLPVATIPDAFDATFPDRDALAAATGWARERIDSIDVYRSSEVVYCFPTATELLAAVPDEWYGSPRLVPTTGYELAERCPLLVANRVGEGREQ